MTCFSRLRRAVSAVMSEGGSSPRHVDRLTADTQVFFVVWPIEPFVSEGGSPILNAASSANCNAWLCVPQKKTAHLPLQKTTIKAFQVWLSDHSDINSAHKAVVGDSQGSWFITLIEILTVTPCHILLWLVLSVQDTLFFLVRLFFRVHLNLLRWSRVQEEKLLCWLSSCVCPLGPQAYLHPDSQVRHTHQLHTILLSVLESVTSVGLSWDTGSQSPWK